ncbi:MAG: M1 family metallopeptidase [Saprospiraceae bacterium]|nr:M1 family metallopeptidase [Saprospiraceae bacterium]MCF8310113.1 M1 family metallopeptidase [Saprospiraceae bacterium]MCF8439013.1 M1 family metallopeptidase [Saprospiraceae bacterium]
MNFWSAFGQCDPHFDPPKSSRPTSYVMDVQYDLPTKSVKSTGQVIFKNNSPVPVTELQFYMYLNSFKNMGSTFLKGSGGNIFDQNIGSRGADTWGWIRVDDIAEQNGANLTQSMRYIQLDDGNAEDQSVLSVTLQRPVQPGETAVFDLKFSAKLPKLIARAGWSKDDYALWVHWFPQLGVWEESPAGDWRWNCHQFFRTTEFFGDFGTYEVTITAPDKLVIGASGCMVSEEKLANNLVRRRYLAEDVIDFAWVAYPGFLVFEDKWQHVNIRLLIPPEHAMHSYRFITAVKQSLEYMTAHVGPYPFSSITMADPPFHGLRSGMMEYPTFITLGSFYGWPKGIRSVESLAVHEFVHQYFMMMLASNEKEEAWLDEGFVTYYEDRIIDHFYGKKTGYIDFLGYKMGNQELSRNEYTGMKNQKEDYADKPGWTFDGRHKGIVYSKTATMLQTLQAVYGDKAMDELMRTYFERWKFKHPRGKDFFEVANEWAAKYPSNPFGTNLDWLFKGVIQGTDVCDYAVSEIFNLENYSPHGLFDDGKGNFIFKKGEPTGDFTNSVTLHRLGELIYPVEVEIRFEDGSVKMENWDGQLRTKIFSYQTKSKIESVHIDPQQKITLDIDLNNNSISVKPKDSVLWKFTLKAVFWMQNLMQTVSFLV